MQLDVSALKCSMCCILKVLSNFTYQGRPGTARHGGPGDLWHGPARKIMARKILARHGTENNGTEKYFLLRTAAYCNTWNTCNIFHPHVHQRTRCLRRFRTLANVTIGTCATAAKGKPSAPRVEGTALLQSPTAAKPSWTPLYYREGERSAPMGLRA